MTNLKAEWRLIVAAILFLLPVIAYVANFWKFPLSVSASDWGAFGDYFGGVSGVLATVMVVFYQVRLQAKMNELQREMMKEQEKINNFQIDSQYLDRSRSEVEFFLNEVQVCIARYSRLTLVTDKGMLSKTIFEKPIKEFLTDPNFDQNLDDLVQKIEKTTPTLIPSWRAIDLVLGTLDKSENQYFNEEADSWGLRLMITISLKSCIALDVLLQHSQKDKKSNPRLFFANPKIRTTN